MSLTLKVLSFKNQPITEISAVFVGNNGGSIGRSDDNDLVLPDTEKFVSRHHATISFKNDCYYLSDTSLGGIYINNRETPLRNGTECIDNGTILKIGEYEIAVAIEDEQEIDDFFSANGAVITPEPRTFLQTEEPGFELEEVGFNSLMADNFPRHEELVQSQVNERPVAFESGLRSNHSPLFDSYIAPSIIPPPAIEEIPENLSFDDFFSEGDLGAKLDSKSPQVFNKPTVENDFEDFFGAAISDMAAEIDQPTVIADVLTENNPEPCELATVALNNKPEIEQTSSSLLDFDSPKSAETIVEAEISHEDNKIKRTNVLVKDASLEKTPQACADSVLFNAFLQGADIECNEILPEQQTETLHRIGQMFRKLIDGTVAVLRSRAEFKSLCRVNMTVIRATDNNPLKFTVSTDDVLRQLIENKADGFLVSTVAIEESFNDIMNHQLAMQAGIQASLTDLLKTFAPDVIEKQFEQGIVLQKKAKCWDRYEETYRNTVEDAVENFFGDEFVKAYEKQMSLLTNSRRK